MIQKSDAIQIGQSVSILASRVQEGLLGKILAPDGGEIEHYDRFILPSIAQVEYRLGDRNIVVSNCLTPVTDTLVRMHTVGCESAIWTWLLKPFVLPFALRVVKQDQVMLKTQLDCIEDFGEQFVQLHRG